MISGVDPPGLTPFCCASFCSLSRSVRASAIDVPANPAASSDMNATSFLMWSSLVVWPLAAAPAGPSAVGLSAFLHHVDVGEHVEVDVAVDDQLALPIPLDAAHHRLGRGVAHHPGHR